MMILDAIGTAFVVLVFSVLTAGIVGLISHKVARGAGTDEQGAAVVSLMFTCAAFVLALFYGAAVSWSD